MTQHKVTNRLVQLCGCTGKVMTIQSWHQNCIFRELAHFIVPDPSDLWPLFVFETVSPTAIVIFSILNKLGFNFMVTMTILNGFIDKTIFTFWLLVTLINTAIVFLQKISPNSAVHFFKFHFYAILLQVNAYTSYCCTKWWMTGLLFTQ